MCVFVLKAIVLLASGFPVNARLDEEKKNRQQIVNCALTLRVVQTATPLLGCRGIWLVCGFGCFFVVLLLGFDCCCFEFSRNTQTYSPGGNSNG